jgi:lipoprotein-releasing system ATP-binding protein
VIGLKGNNLARFRNDRLGFIFQFHQLLPEFTALENVIIPALLGNRSKSIAMEKGSELLNFLGLGDRLKHKPSELSGGEQQRVAVARALINDPDIILMDEPFSSLDTITKSKIQKLTWSLLKNKTVIMVTHDPLEALMLSNTLYYVSNKQLKPIKLPSSKPLRKITNDNLIYSYKYILNLLKKSYI